MNINKVKHDKCDWSSDTSLYLQSGINVFSACHFTYSSKTQQEQNLRKSLIISYRVNALQLNFQEILCYHILSLHKKFMLKLISAKFLLPMISPNEPSITLSTLWYDCTLAVPWTIFIYIETLYGIVFIIIAESNIIVLLLLNGILRLLIINEI